MPVSQGVSLYPVLKYIWKEYLVHHIRKFINIKCQNVISILFHLFLIMFKQGLSSESFFNNRDKEMCYLISESELTC